MTKKKTFLKVLNWLKDAGFKAFAILLIVAAGFYTLAAITWPADEPNPTTGVVGMFVGESTAAFTAGDGYSKVNELCSNLVAAPGAHICTQDEMMNSLNHGKTGIAPIYTYYDPPTQPNPYLWINSGPPGYTSNANDCKGWTKTDSPLSNQNFGRIWNFDEQYGGLLPCDNTGFKFACCK